MFPASTRGGGTTFVFPDVCKVPAPPAPPIPTPFPNTGQCADARGSTCSKRVKISNKQVLTRASVIPTTHGDEPGTLKGMISSTTGSQLKYKTSFAKVKVEGKEIVTHLKMTSHNGSNANAPPGTQVAPSQTKVTLGG